jgi:hypothetical protein
MFKPAGMDQRKAKTKGNVQPHLSKKYSPFVSGLMLSLFSGANSSPSKDPGCRSKVATLTSNLWPPMFNTIRSSAMTSFESRNKREKVLP